MRYLRWQALSRAKPFTSPSRESQEGSGPLVNYDKVAGKTEAGPWNALCESCGEHELGGSPSDLIFGYYQTQAEADEVAATHVRRPPPFGASDSAGQDPTPPPRAAHNVA
jgi:hypothetical protein